MIEIVYRFDPQRAPHAAPPADSAEAQRRLEEGNRGFAHVLDHVPLGRTLHRRIVQFDPRDIGFAETEGTTPQQRPFAVVLGCSDARVPTELVFSQWCNELFVVRVAGNVLGNEALGSIDYAVHNLRDSIKLVVVLAHSGCGAVTAAVDVFLKPAHYLDLASSHPLRMIVDRLVVVVRGAARALEQAWGATVGRQPGYRQALIETSVAFNAALTAFTLDREIRTRHRHAKTVFGVYDLASRCVTLRDGAPEEGGSPPVRLADTPVDNRELTALANRIAGSSMIRSILTAP